MPVTERKVWAQSLQVKYQVSIVKSCDVASISRSAYYYEPKLSDDDEIIHELSRLTELKLNMRRKSKKRLPNRSLKPLVPASVLGKSWSIDFMSDSLHNKVRFRTFNVIDDFNREVLGIDIAVNLPRIFLSTGQKFMGL